MTQQGQHLVSVLDTILILGSSTVLVISWATTTQCLPQLHALTSAPQTSESLLKCMSPLSESRLSSRVNLTSPSYSDWSNRHSEPQGDVGKEISSKRGYGCTIGPGTQGDPFSGTKDALIKKTTFQW